MWELNLNYMLGGVVIGIVWAISLLIWKTNKRYLAPSIADTGFKTIGSGLGVFFLFGHNFWQALATTIVVLIIYGVGRRMYYML